MQTSKQARGIPSPISTKAPASPGSSLSRSAQAFAGVKERAIAREARQRDKPLEAARIPGAVKAALPVKMAPQLATLTETAPPGTAWLSEIKFDGYRMMARLYKGDVRIYSRNQKPWTDRLPEIAAELAKLPVDQAWVDGEVVALDGEGRSNFSRMKDALGAEITARLVFYVFDILHLDGFDLTPCRQDDRKRVLQAVMRGVKAPRLHYSDHHDGDPAEMHAQACGMKLEGIILKDPAAPYRQARSRSWLKLKCLQREEFIVIGFTEPQGSRTSLGALMLGYFDPKGRLHYAGGVGSGFNRETLANLREILEPMRRKIPPAITFHGEKPRGVNWVSPKLVVETSFLEWTADKVVRHSVYLGIRDDKEGRDVVREVPEDR